MATSKDHIKSKTQLWKIILPTTLILFSLTALGQTSNSDFERIKLGGNDTEFTGIDISPDQKTLAVTAKKSEPVKLIDWSSQKVTQEINAGNWLTGSTVSFSDGGKYLLLQEIGYTDFSQNIDRKINFEVVDVATGNSIMKFENIQDAVVSSDEKQAISLDNDEITFWSLPSGKKEKSFSITGARNAVSLNSDGKILAVSQLVDAADFKSQFKKDKKGLKNAAKYKQIVSLFNAESGAKMRTIGEFYDIIYNLRFLPESDLLFVYQTPDARIQANNKKLSYINLIDGKKQEPLRKGFTSMSIAQPDLKISGDNKLFAVNSKGTRFQEMHLYDYETGTLQKRFELGHRLFEKVDGEKMINGTRPAFIFLPGNQSILIAMGNQLIKWNIEFNSSEQ
jgi:WD40 repeat protein